MTNKPIKCDYCDRQDATLHVVHVHCRSIPYDRVVAICPKHRDKLKEIEENK